MKTIIDLADTIHDFEKTNLVTNSDGSDDYKCKKCGLKGKRWGLGSSMKVSGKKSLIENCAGETRVPEAQPIETDSNPVPGDEVLDHVYLDSVGTGLALRHGEIRED